MQSTDEKYMKEAIKQAKKAYAIGEVPIGCVIVYQDKIIGRGYNRRTIDNNTLAHAELIAIKKASKKMNDWRLEDCTMYVTLEPCQMCSGAIVQSRMTRVVVGCMNPKAGCAGSILNLLDMPEFNHQVELTTGVMEEECSQMMKSFFKELREARKKKKQLEKEQIGYVNGVLGGVVSALNVLCSHGDCVVLQSPTYIGFTHAIEDNGWKIVLNPMIQDED